MHLNTLDGWPVHVGEPFRSWMRTKYSNILLLFIPPNCTGQLQPHDVVVQKPLRGDIKAAFKAFQIERFQKARRLGGDEHYAVLCNFKISVIKPYTLMWFHGGWKRAADDKDMLHKGWPKCGLRDVFDPSTQANTIKEAKLSSNDRLHTLHPLFPQNHRTAVPLEVLKGCMEPQKEPIILVDDPEDSSDVTADIVMDILSASQVSEQPTRVQHPVVALFPLFSARATAKRKSAANGCDATANGKRSKSS